METTTFIDKYFELNKGGLHLLRNGFRYKTIAFPDLQSVKVGKGKSLKNWWLLLSLGAVLSLGAMLFAISIFNFFTHPESEGEIYIEEIAAVAVAFFLGLYCLYAALKNEEVIEFIHTKGSERFPTATLVQKGQLEAMISFLRKRTRVDQL